MELYPYTFEPIYRERIWGGRNFERLFGRTLPEGVKIGESWELADLKEGVSVVDHGSQAGTPLTELSQKLGKRLLGTARPMPDGRFPLLLKLLDANDILSLQVHPDARAAKAIGGGAAMKTECWYVVESRGGFIYRGLKRGAKPETFLQMVQDNTVDKVVNRTPVKTGQFYYLPAGTVHALGAGVVVAEAQTPSDTTYRVTDWGRGREIHVDRAMQCIHFETTHRRAPGTRGHTLLESEYFRVEKHGGEKALKLPRGLCRALMFLRGGGPLMIGHNGAGRSPVELAVGRTALLPAELDCTLEGPKDGLCLMITPERGL